MYYLKYMPKTDDNLEIQNLKKVIEYSEEYLKSNNEFNITFINKLHKILLNSVRGNEKEPGKIRNIQNWIGPKGCTIDEAMFVPPIPEEVPILFLSEIIELYKPSYHKFLNESRKGNMLGFIKFFLQCIIEQCNNYILKINRIKQIYKTDMEKIKKINGNSIYRIMPVAMKQIVFTKKEIVEESGVFRNIVSERIDELVKMGILEIDTTYAKKAYKYKEIYNVFVGKDIF